MGIEGVAHVQAAANQCPGIVALRYVQH